MRNMVRLKAPSSNLSQGQKLASHASANASQTATLKAMASESQDISCWLCIAGGSSLKDESFTHTLQNDGLFDDSAEEHCKV